MGERIWTKEQNDAITLRGRECIVSASAGSGKTAVLIERIFNEITDPDHGTDVDRLLVVTFTNAAAAEMRERLLYRIEEELSKGNELNERERANLIRQSNLVSSAQISTIDSFCKRIVAEHFNEIDIDPGYRLADEAELKLIRSDVIAELLENKYLENDEHFRRFERKVCGDRGDSELEEIIEDLYRESDSAANPNKWLSDAKKVYGSGKVPYAEYAENYAHNIIEGALDRLKIARDMCMEPDGPVTYLQNLEDDIKLVEELRGLDFEGLCSALAEFRFGTLSRKAAPDTLDPYKKEFVKGLRDDVKDEIKDLKSDFFDYDTERILADMDSIRDDIFTAIDLTIMFRDAYSAVKRKKNIADFSDVAHMALNILTDEDGRPTGVAREYRERFAEILIDEYQDSNDLQEALLRSVSREEEGQPNIFMVGDVKQSIYKFRQAKPELFMEKYNTYKKHEDGSHELKEKIILRENFRSRLNILNTVNAFFRNIMKAELGGVEYDSDAELVSGTAGNTSEGKDELLVLNLKEESSLFETDSNMEAESYLVANRIKELVKDGACYKDIVILLRTMKGWGDTFVSILNDEGIPAVCETSTGYFSALEVANMLDLLKVIDNPRQDIPLCSCLMSYIGGFTADDMARLKINAGDRKYVTFYELLCESDEEKSVAFVEKLNRWRELARYTPIHELILRLYEETAFYAYVSAMPGGVTRRANLDMLTEKAADFEKTSYHGLFHFIRYIEKLNKYEIDYGEATAASGENVVRIMSIHKSKGLQFPICIVAGLNKKFNAMDENRRVITHTEFGISMGCVDLVTRKKKTNYYKNLIKNRMHVDLLGEELRVLYVAMTRAEKKLILTAAVKDTNKMFEKAKKNAPGYATLIGAQNYLDILMSAYMHDDRISSYVDLVIKNKEDLFSEARISEYEKRIGVRLKLTEAIERAGGNAVDVIRSENDYIYPYADVAKLKNKMTVSEIKALAHSEEEFGEVVAYEKESYIPSFAKTEEVMAGNTRGTIYHSVMEKMDFEGMCGADRNSIHDYLDAQVAAGALTADDRAAVSDYKIQKIMAGNVAARMKKAAETGRLHRESPFVIAAENDILIQGIIDVWFEEDDGIVLLDYKTDRVDEENGEQILIDRYKVQLDYYEKALHNTTDMKVKERIIYSFGLGKEIQL